jgi:hypothetical protein
VKRGEHLEQLIHAARSCVRAVVASSSAHDVWRPCPFAARGRHRRASASTRAGLSISSRTWGKLTRALTLSSQFCFLSSSLRAASFRFGLAFANRAAWITSSGYVDCARPGDRPTRNRQLLRVLELRSRLQRVRGRAGQDDLAHLLLELGHRHRDVVLAHAEERTRQLRRSHTRPPGWAPRSDR